MALKIGERIHCQELNTGSNLTGILTVSDETMRVRIHSYDDFFSIRPVDPAFLKTESADIVSLYSNATETLGRTVCIIDQEGGVHDTIYHQEIISSVLVVGYDRWEEGDKVKQVRFKVRYVDDLLIHREKVRSIRQNFDTCEENYSLFREKSRGLTLVAWYAASYDYQTDLPKDLSLIFGIEFDEPVNLFEYITYVSDYVIFLSFLLGVRLTPLDIYIDRFSAEERSARISAGSYLGNHRVHYVWHEDDIEKSEVSGFGSPVRANDDGSLSSLRASLVAWMNRAREWQNPYKLMMGSFTFRHTISADRLLNAYRWFEQIPTAKTQSGLSNEHLTAISLVACDKATELGHSELVVGRIQNAIRSLGSETAEERFIRLVNTVREKFGDQILPDEVVGHLTDARRFRGKVAHGHFEPDNDSDSQAFYKSICAMEALCFLLTVRDLPISEQGREQIWLHPSVNRYLYACG